MKILVTGAAGLIGRSVCKALDEENKIMATDVASGFGNLDVTNESQVKEFFKVNQVDAVIHCAYPRTKDWGKKFYDVSCDSFSKNIEMQLGGAFNIVKHACKYFSNSGGGNIILLGSVSGVMNPRFETYEGLEMTTPVAYSCIKSGLISLCKYAVKYCKQKNIRINVISVSGILDQQDPRFVERYKELCLNKGMLETEDLIGLIKFLISDESMYINGQNIIIDDGFTLY